ncbi:ParB/RepB/Spo0J family partition protein [Loktanella sp. M215]|uniref:ParB/RepB/Spo0J family partition protein n=1 Tax=Loktanella sp. M215 TaxID=2675431 RepID=UPI001EFFF1AC|nr:ParB/RepB/Spo0J family partition protein [Loktanella sp. M215]
MARNVFEHGPTDDPNATTEAQPLTPRRKPLVKGGAASPKYISAATQGGADRTYQEIPVDQIRESAVMDRIDVNEDLDALVESIRENGQQIPILVRIFSGGDKPFEIVVGRRRLAAHRQLGKHQIKAFVARMDDREAFIAQGIENTARLETSYIERARAAAQALDVGFDQKDVAEFLNISRTLINFMVGTYRSVGEDLVTAIGPARGIGRRKWDALVKLMDQNDLSPERAVKLVDRDIADSSTRFETFVMAVQAARKTAKQSPTPKTGIHREFLSGGVSTVRKSRQLVIKTRKDMPQEILVRIEQEIETILSEFQKNVRG